MVQRGASGDARLGYSDQAEQAVFRCLASAEPGVVFSAGRRDVSVVTIKRNPARRLDCDSLLLKAKSLPSGFEPSAF